jgi:hypothetical protein
MARTPRAVSWFASIVCLSLALAGPSLAGDPPDLAAPDLTALVGQAVEILLKTGKSISDAEVTKIAPGAEPGTVKSMTVKTPPNKVQGVSVMSVDEIYLAGQPLDVAFDIKSKTLAHSPDKRKARIEKAARVAEQLKSKRAQLWKDYSESEQQQFVDEEKKYLDTVGEKFSGMVLYETKYYLFYTDMPQAQIAGYIAYLDNMYGQLCKAFGIPEGKNIWRGKCVVICFLEEKRFLDFERTFVNNPNASGAQGIAHSYSNGRVVISCFRGSDPVYFAAVLVHETSHGFVHRYMSSARVPTWINEGIADWVAAAVVRGDDSVESRQREGAQRAKQLGNLGSNFFDGNRFENWQYGIAMTIVDMLLKIDGKKYRQFIDGIKEGLDWEESLKQAYNMTPADVVQRYGQYIGAPNLRQP